MLSALASRLAKGLCVRGFIFSTWCDIRISAAERPITTLCVQSVTPGVQILVFFRYLVVFSRSKSCKKWSVLGLMSTLLCCQDYATSAQVSRPSAVDLWVEPEVMSYRN